MPLVSKKEYRRDKEYSLLKRYVFTAVLNEGTLLLCRICRESSFHDVGRTTEKAFFLHRLSTGDPWRRRVLGEDLRSDLGGVKECSWSRSRSRSGSRLVVVVVVAVVVVEDY